MERYLAIRIFSRSLFVFLSFSLSLDILFLLFLLLLLLFFSQVNKTRVRRPFNEDKSLEKLAHFCLIVNCVISGLLVLVL